MCIKIGLPICAYTLYTLSPGVNITPYPCVVAPVTYTHQTAIHIHLPTLSPTLSPSGPTGWRPMLDHLHISSLPLINAIHMTISSTINLIGWRPMLDHPHITHPHHTYYTHTLTPSSHSNTLYTHLPTPTPSLVLTLHMSYPIYICPILEPTHPLTWYRD